MQFLKWFHEMLMDWPIGTVLALFTALLAIVVSAFIVCGVYTALDSWFLPRNHGMGIIVGKKFTPAHTDTIYIYNAATKTSLPQIILYADDWSVRVQVESRQDDISVGEKMYDSLTERDSVIAEYVNGRLSGDLYLKGISRI